MIRSVIAAAVLACSVACADGPLHAANIQIGRAINPDDSVGSPSTLFKPNETIYVAVLTDAAGKGTISVKWMYGDRVIDEPTKQVSFKGPGATAFQMQNSGGFPPGSYSVEVFVDGVECGQTRLQGRRREVTVMFRLIVTAFAALVWSGQAPLRPDPPIKCDACDEWNQPREPFRIFGNTYYVGTAGLSAILITSERGHILLDGGLSQSAPVIDANIRKLGFKTEDVKLILNSHAHYDHAAGIAALQRASGAIVAATASGAQALQSGENTPDDPQFGFGHDANAFPPVKNVRVVKDQEVIEIAGLAIQTHDTAGHTPGSTTWTWRSCVEGRAA